MKLNDLTLNGMEVAIRQTDSPSVLKKLNDVYEQGTKLVFLFDCSGSMGSAIASDSIDKFIWTADKLADIRIRAHAAWVRLGELIKIHGADNARYEIEDEEYALAEMCDMATGVPNPSDEAIQTAIVQNDLMGFLKIEVNWATHDQKPLTRIDLVKKLARRELEKRLEKLPDSSIAVVEFGRSMNSNPEDENSAWDDIVILFNDGNKDQLWAAVEELKACGGTNILGALAAGIQACKDKPSPVGVHHFILVTDGEDGRADRQISTWVSVLKASGVVLDYIHIGDQSYRNHGIVAACEALGGEYVVVNSEADFERKFVEAMGRLCLPPAN